jgi:hypothetical protein
MNWLLSSVQTVKLSIDDIPVNVADAGNCVGATVKVRVGESESVC